MDMLDMSTTPIQNIPYSKSYPIHPTAALLYPTSS